MDYRSIGFIGVGVLSMVLLPIAASGQQTPANKQLVGTWTLVSHEAVRADGSKVLPLGRVRKASPFSMLMAISSSP